MNKQDIALLNKQIKRDLVLVAIMLISLFVAWLIFKSNKLIGNLVLILGAIGIIASFIVRGSIYKDLISKKKYSGKQHVINKEKVKRFRTGNNFADYYYVYMITFSDWRIGDIRFEEEYWEKINIDDVFFIEQAVNSKMVLTINKKEINFMPGVKNDYKDTKSSLER